MDPYTKFKVGDRLFVMSLCEAWSKYGNDERDEIVFPEEKAVYTLSRRKDFFAGFEGRVATITRVHEVTPNHFHYSIDLDEEGLSWCPTMFSGYADDEEEIEPPDPMSMWYFLGIEENRNPRKRR